MVQTNERIVIMSGGTVCKCEESKKDIGDRCWLVLSRKCNYSAFNGYHHTPSDYSQVTCLKCPACWRTKAQYVDELDDADDKYYETEIIS